MTVQSDLGTGSFTFPSNGVYEAFGEYLKVPTVLMERLEPDLVGRMFNHLLIKINGPVTVHMTEQTVLDVYPPTIKIIEPRKVVEIASRVIPDGQIINFSSTRGGFYLDLVAPEGHRSAELGDPKVGDITAAGLRFEGHHMKLPTVEEFFYRLQCTNGAQSVNHGSAVSGRGSMEDFLIEFEHMADLKFRAVEETIRNFYDLRTKPVPNFEQAVIRYSGEHHLADSLRIALVENIPELPEDERQSEFDLANFFTNFANSPDLVNSDRRRLERLGGVVVSDHAARCAACAAKLN